MAAHMFSIFCRQLCRNSKSQLSVLSSINHCKNGQNISWVPKVSLNFAKPVAIVNRGYCSEAEYPISRYPVPNQDELPQDMQDLINEVAEKSGFVPNVFQALAHRPDEFRAFFMYYDALMAKETGSLTKADKEMIVVATSSVNNCLYCVISHSALFRIYSKNPTLADQVAANWECAELDPRQRAIVEFAIAVCKSETITEEHFKKLEAHGLDREDAWDIGAIAAFFAMSNRMAHLTDMRPNKEFYLMGRVPKDKK
ncbi:uncharacterized protein LOC119719984 [Patiria miniata]|uniref:Carboxymuconolactone decarboxylase-like domain-containing protein n=1 Tax=Patiria miniata TaxID=46514 RepID=A0A913Z0Q3_PATMI|nr:uncharacterized protein LOC119719984 [Patiria miniata]